MVRDVCEIGLTGDTQAKEIEDEISSAHGGNVEPDQFVVMRARSSVYDRITADIRAQMCKETALRRRDASGNLAGSRRLNGDVSIAALFRQRKRTAISSACVKDDRVS